MDYYKDYKEKMNRYNELRYNNSKMFHFAQTTLLDYIQNWNKVSTDSEKTEILIWVGYKINIDSKKFKDFKNEIDNINRGKCEFEIVEIVDILDKYNRKFLYKIKKIVKGRKKIIKN